MPTYKVDLSYKHVDVEDLDQVEALALALPDDTHFMCIDGQTRITAMMAAVSAIEAVEKVVEAVHTADDTAEPVQAELTLMTITDIADVVGLNREAVRLWVVGKRGPGNFPAPLDIVGDRVKVWAASDVYSWLATNVLPRPAGRPLSVSEVTDARRAIERLRRRWAGSPVLTDTAQWHVAKQEAVTVPVMQARQKARAS